jgi:hypothetical protein
MLVQQENVDASDVATSMWAHEEDAGVQMLGCVALSKLLLKAKTTDDVLIISLKEAAIVVNVISRTIFFPCILGAQSGLSAALGQSPHGWP